MLEFQPVQLEDQEHIDRDLTHATTKNYDECFATLYSWKDTYHAAYARTQGCLLLRLEEEGIAMPVIEAVCHYKASAKYDDLLEVTGRFAEAKGVKVKIECEVRRNGKILVEGYTVHACMDMKTGRPTRPPEFIRALLTPKQ